MIRKIHLFLGLFLTPWVVMYAASTILMQHREWFTGNHNRIEPEYKLVREGAYSRSFGDDEDRQVASRQILGDLKLEGAFNVRGSVDEGRLEIRRDKPIGSYRITWEANPGTVRVEKQAFGMAFFLEMLHRRRGFNQPFQANDAWAVIVDLVILAILAWAFTGLWMWWRMRSTHRLGSLCALLGSALFALFLLTI